MSKTAVIAMSGGVDSTVAALLMKRQGFECIGVTMRVCDSFDEKPAQDAARQLGIPLIVLDLRQEFHETVSRRFVDEYRRGMTPNPCIDCNCSIKFGVLYDKAMALGADVFVTGHYARVEKCGEAYVLKRGADKAKDQSYFLYSIAKEKLARIRFPLGACTKAQVRQIAAEAGLMAVGAKESQDVCFISGGYRDYLIAHGAKDKPGDFIDVRGNILGRHRGVWRYTIGQRRGLGVAVGSPLYVCGIDAERNVVTLGAKEELRVSGVRAGVKSRK